LIPYVKSKVETALLADQLVKAGVKMSDVLALLNNKRPHRTLRNRIAVWLMRKPMHDVDRIDELYTAYGLPTLTKNAAGKAGLKTLREKVQKTVKRRHEISHYGDYFPGKKEVQPLKVKTAKEWIKWSKKMRCVRGDHQQRDYLTAKTPTELRHLTPSQTALHNTPRRTDCRPDCRLHRWKPASQADPHR
jgi:hypothetical protein